MAPGGGLTGLGITVKVRIALLSSSTSHTRRSFNAYTTRSPLPDAAGTASGSAVGFGLAEGWADADAAGFLPGVDATEAGAFAEAW